MEIKRYGTYVPIELDTHDKYLALLDTLEQRAAYIMLVPVGGMGDDPVLEQARTCMELADRRSVTEWPGTVTSGKGAERYIFAAGGAFFDFLRQFPAFFFWYKDSWGCDAVMDTGFGEDDIAFLDREGGLLFFTTTHEGFADGIPGLI